LFPKIRYRTNSDVCRPTPHLTKDSELRKVSEELTACQLRLAVDGMCRGREVGYSNVSVFVKAGEAAADYLAEGWMVAVDGRIELGRWESEGGENRHDDMVVGNVALLTAPRAAEDPPAPVTEAHARPARKSKELVTA
jgi:single-stranded DNA-binding protein